MLLFLIPDIEKHDYPDIKLKACCLNQLM
uniref:Uncharacterized protein n=1 Tax=Anguilla anguilla TaxID=7936 RepID=A0A0E9SLX7_ANGAN